MTAVDWDRAPEGAVAWAVDADGTRWWFDSVPYIFRDEWVAYPASDDAPDFGYVGDWRESLVVRPHAPTADEWEIAHLMDEAIDMHAHILALRIEIEDWRKAHKYACDARDEHHANERALRARISTLAARWRLRADEHGNDTPRVYEVERCAEELESPTMGAF